MTETANSTTELEESLRLFHTHRRQLIEVASTLSEPYKDANEFFARALSSSSSQPLFSGLEAAQASIWDLQRMSPDGAPSDANPCLVVLGQTKAGKSSLINALIGADVLPSSSLACTARLTRLTYGSRHRIRLRPPPSQDGQTVETEWTELPSFRLPSSLLNLAPEERHKVESVTTVVDAQIPSPLLNSGIDLIDCPGRNENQNLRKLTDAVFEGVLPLIVYVIDGRRLLTQEDVNDLDNIRRAHPVGDVFYVVTKLDHVTSRRRSMTNSEEMTRKSKAEVFRALVNRGLLPEEHTPDDCPLFHGVSLFHLAKWRQKREAKILDPDSDPPPLVKAFERLQEELFRFIRNRLDARVIDAALGLEETASYVLRCGLQRANASARDIGRLQHRLHIEMDLEEAIFGHLQQTLNTGDGQAAVRAEFDNFLQFFKSSLLRKVTSYKYSSEIFVGRGEAVAAKCREDLLQFLLLCLTTELRYFLEKKILSKQMALLKKSADSWVPKLSTAFCELTVEEKGRTGQQRQLMSNLAMKIKKKLVTKYLGAMSQVETEMRKSWFLEFLDAVSKFFRDLKQKVVYLFRSSCISSSDAMPDSPAFSLQLDVTTNEWKQAEAERLLGLILNQDFSADILGFLQRHILDVHRDLQAQFKRETELFSTHLNIAANDRRAIGKFVPSFAKAFAIASSVRCHYAIRKIQLRGPIGVGAQGVIYKCEVDFSGERRVIAMKQNECRPERFADQALEIFYATSFDHPNLLPFLGTHIDPVGKDGNRCIRLFSPLMSSNCRSFLQKSPRSPLALRLNIARSVCSAIVDLHTHGIIHRDIKLENVLLNDQHNAFIADYGLCKAVGLLSRSLVGSPIHMAPEMIEKALASVTGIDAVSQEVSHSEAIDIYAFGIFLWFLVEGNGHNPHYVVESHDIFDVLNAARFGARPERPSEANEELWALMEECWLQEPVRRPHIEEVQKRLNAICDSNDSDSVEDEMMN